MPPTGTFLPRYASLYVRLILSLSLSLSLSLLCSLAYMKLSNAHLRGGCNNLAKDYERRKAARPTAFFRSSCPILQWDPVEFSLRSVECNLLLACSLTRSFVTRFERIQRRASSLESARTSSFFRNEENVLILYLPVKSVTCSPPTYN